MAGPSLHAASGEEHFGRLPPHLKADQLSQNFATINNMKYSGTASTTAVGVGILKTVLFP
jgi:hypothetical protein